MTNLSINDAMFLLGETRDHPAHVIALQLFRPPADAPADYVQQMHEAIIGMDDIKSVFTKYPVRNRLSPTQLSWRVDPDLDLGYHVRRSALPTPGRVRELLELVSAHHGVPLHRPRPLWDFQLIEGLADGRFATAFKTHHALADGMSLARHVLGGLSTDPTAQDCTPPWIATKQDEQERETSRPARVKMPIASRLRDGLLTAPATVRALRDMRFDAAASVPYDAPRSILNAPLTGARRFAGDVWPHARLKAVAVASSCTVNDVVLAVCSGALRSYLDELNALPDKPLIAMVPVSLRGQDSSATPGEGNAFGSILCNLRTTDPDAGSRLAGIRESMVGSKERLSGMRPAEVNAVSRLIMGGSALTAFGLASPARQPFNLVISNVPAASAPLYWNGAEMTELYPMSMISEGQAMNITVTRYVDKLAFGVVGCRTAVPHLQRMLVHLETALAELEKATA